MIQRIQSLYLLGIFTIALTMIAVNIIISEGVITQNGVKTNFKITALSTTYLSTSAIIEHNIPLLISVVFCGLIAIISVFLFKNLKLQNQLVKFNFLLILSTIALIFYEIYKATDSFSFISEANLSIFIALPFLMLIFNFLAVKGIKKDIDLLASADRLR